MTVCGALCFDIICTCRQVSLDSSARATAVHPFREGNGRAISFYLDALSPRVRGDVFD